MLLVAVFNFMIKMTLRIETNPSSLCISRPRQDGDGSLCAGDALDPPSADIQTYYQKFLDKFTTSLSPCFLVKNFLSCR
jgi:hypothetical protein